MVSPVLQHQLSSLSRDNSATNNSLVGAPFMSSPEVRKNSSSFDSSTSDTTQQTKDRFTDTLLPNENGMIHSSPSTFVRCFAGKAFATTNDELRSDLRHLQVQLQKSQERRVKLEQELVEAKQVAVMTRERFQESQRQYNQLKTEVETIQTSEEANREDSQVHILHSQRTVLAQRVLQLLAQNGKLQSTSVKLHHQMEQQDVRIQQLEQELCQLRNSEATMMMMAQSSNTTTNTSRSWIGRSNPASKQGPKVGLHAMDAPPCGSPQGLLEERIQELENQNRLLLEQQEQSKQLWDQERNRMQQQMALLKQKALQLEPSQRLHRSESPQKRDFPPLSISYEEDEDTQDNMTHSTCSVTQASRSSYWTSPSAYLALQGRLQVVEAQLQEREATEVALTQQVEALRQSALEERQRAESAEERVQQLRAYLNDSWSKQRGPRHHNDISFDVDPTHNVDHQENERSLPALGTSTVHDEPSNPLDNPSLNLHEPIETLGETNTSGELDNLQQRFQALEQKCRSLDSKNAQLHHRLEQLCQENAELEDLVEQLKSRNGDGAETIFALLRHVEKSAESDANQKALRQQLDQLTAERENLENRLGETEQHLAEAKYRIAELNDLNARSLNVEAPSSNVDLQKSLQVKVDEQERQLNDYKAQYDQLHQESTNNAETVKQLQEQNEWLLAEIAILSQKSASLSAELDSAKDEVERLRQPLPAAIETAGSQTEPRDTTSENEDDLQKQPASLGNEEDTESLRGMVEALETSLKEANEQRRELEIMLSNTRLDLEIAQGKIDDLSNGRATAHVDVSTNPTSIDSRLHIYHLEKENQSLSRTCEDKERRLNEALMQCNQHEQMLETVTVQVLELQLQINELEEGKRELMKRSETQLDAANAFSNDLESRIKDLQCEIISLESERDALQSQVESQRAWLESSASKLYEMEDALETCREELHSSKLRVKDLEGKVHEFDEDATSLASGDEAVDVDLSSSSDDQLNQLADSENTSPNHGKRTLKEIFSFGRRSP